MDAPFFCGLRDFDLQAVGKSLSTSVTVNNIAEGRRVVG